MSRKVHGAINIANDKWDMRPSQNPVPETHTETLKPQSGLDRYFQLDGALH